MPDDFVLKQTVFKNLPRTDVVYDERPLAIFWFFSGDNADMCDGTAQIPTHDVAWRIVFGVWRDFLHGAVSGKKHH